MHFIYNCFSLITSYWQFFLVFLILYKNEKNDELLLFAITICMSFIINAFLKELWKVPLDQSLNNDWWAFPSGHIQNFIIFAGAMFIYFKRLWLAISILPVFCIIVQAYVYNKYHDIPEMLAGFSVSLMIVTFMYWANRILLRYPKFIVIYGFFTSFVSLLTVILILERHIYYYSWLIFVISVSFALTIFAIAKSYAFYTKNIEAIRNISTMYNTIFSLVITAFVFVISIIWKLLDSYNMYIEAFCVAAITFLLIFLAPFIKLQILRRITSDA